jgi:hypothetical protein
MESITPEKTPLPPQTLVPAVLDYAHCPKPTPRGGVQRNGLSSFVCGFLFFVPLIMQVYAIGLGLLAVRGQPKSLDRGFGIAGIAMGIGGLLFWIWEFAALVLLQFNK